MSTFTLLPAMKTESVNLMYVIRYVVDNNLANVTSTECLVVP